MAILQVWPLVLGLLVAGIMGKALIIFLIGLLFRQHPYTALITGVSLAHVGEFSFIIAREALSSGVISATLNSLILSLAIISIILNPFLLPLAHRCYRYLRWVPHGAPAEVQQCVEEEFDGAVCSVLLCGYGRVGRAIAQALDTFRVPFLVIDIDRRAVESLHRRGIHAVYGDAANRRLLERIGPEKYQMAVIAVTGWSAVETIVQHLRSLNPEIRLLLRSHSDRETAQALALGVDGVVHVELEASLAFVQAVLIAADVDEEIVTAYLDDIRIGYYDALRPRKRDE